MAKSTKTGNPVQANMGKEKRTNLNKMILLLAGLLIVAIAGVTVVTMITQNRRLTEQPGSAQFPVINPSDRETVKVREARLYFRYNDSGYLVSQVRDVTVGSNERFEAAVLRELISGPSVSSSDLAALLPPNTNVVKIEDSGDTLYVTFDIELLRKELIEVNQQEVDAKLVLMAKSIVNTLTDLGTFSQVQILIEATNGASEPLTRKQVGLDADTPRGDEILEPLNYDADIVLSPRKTMELIAVAAENLQWDEMYRFIARRDSSGSVSSRPSYANFTEVLDRLPAHLTGWEILSVSSGANDNSALIRLDLTGDVEGRSYTRQSVPIILVLENDVWKIPYDTLLRLLETGKE